MALTRELEVACRLAREAGASVRRVRLEGFEAHTKSDESPVTRADTASERVLCDGLLEAFPDDGILSEETANIQEGTSGRTWVLDPLDGTRAFVADRSGYAVQVGLLEAGRPILGVVFEPRDDRLHRAVRGEGAWLDTGDAAPRRLRVSERSEPSEMPLVTSPSMGDDMRERLFDALPTPDAGRLNSVGCKVGMLARREADVYVSEHPVKLWDSCAPVVILEEAGGVLTLADGRPFTYDLSVPRRRHDGPFVATNGTRHEDLCARIRDAMGW
ncbi:MAG: 3'(2'),5'-bisphosphate nucleotidase CysQ family protein [Myxococcota bacterium]